MLENDHVNEHHMNINPSAPPAPDSFYSENQQMLTRSFLEPNEILENKRRKSITKKWIFRISTFIMLLILVTIMLAIFLTGTLEITFKD